MVSMNRNMIRRPSPEILLGAHLSVAGGLPRMLAKACQLGCSAVQIFAANPRGWSGEPVSQAAGAEYRRLAPGCGVHALIVHAIYLANPASPDRELRAKTFRCLRRDLLSAARLGAQAVVLHPGSDRGEAGGEARLESMVRALLPYVPPGLRLLLEGMAGGNRSLGDLATLGRVIGRLGSGVGVCLDSAHLCASGYDLAQAADFRRLDRDLRRHLGYERLGCFHLNDSRQPCGSGRDQHENLGEGYVGRAGLQRCLAHPPFRQVPFILETPGFDDLGPDLKNMRRLRRFAQGAEGAMRRDRHSGGSRNPGV
jgi:deoxyribonuclease IV